MVPRPVRPLDERAVCVSRTGDAGSAEGLYAERRRGRDLRALAGGRRLRARTARGSTRRPGAAAVHDHPAAAERHRLAPPRPRPADRGRGPDDPARPDARPSDAVPARPRPRLDRRPVRARRDPREGGGEPRVARARALPRADAGVRRDDARGDARPAAAGRCVGRLGPPALHDGRGLGQGRPRRLRAALRGGPRVPHRGARQLVPGLPDERQRPRGRRHAGDRHAVDRSLPPHRRGHRPARPGRHDHGRDDPARDDPRRHRGRGPSGRRALRRPRRAPRAHPVRRAGRADHRRRRGRPRVRDGRRQDHAGPRCTTTGRPGSATTCRRSRSWPTTRRSRPPARATTAWTATWRARRSSPISRRAATSCRRPPHEMVIGRCQRSGDVIEPRLKTQWFVRTDAAGRPCAGGDPFGPDADPARAVREDLGALADQHPRLERLAPAVVGPPDPGLVLPRRPRHGVVRARRAGRLRGRAADPPPSSSRTPTSSTPGSAPACGRSRRSAGRTTRPTWRPTTRRRSWRPATTSSSSGSPG